jgi:hypothetical protein
MSTRTSFECDLDVGDEFVLGPEAVAVNFRRRSYTIAAGVSIETPEAEGVLFAQGGVTGGHSLYIKDQRLHYVYSWLAERIQTVSSPDPIPVGTHVLSAAFEKTGDDQATASAVGTLTLYVDTQAVVSAEIMTQPGPFALTGDGLCVGRDSSSAVSPDYSAPFPFIGARSNGSSSMSLATTMWTTRKKSWPTSHATNATTRHKVQSRRLNRARVL